jgi:hypothetical protein
MLGHVVPRLQAAFRSIAFALNRSCHLAPRLPAQPAFSRRGGSVSKKFLPTSSVFFLRPFGKYDINFDQLPAPFSLPQPNGQNLKPDELSELSPRV